MISPLEIYSQKLAMVENLYIEKLTSVGLPVPSFTQELQAATSADQQSAPQAWEQEIDGFAAAQLAVFNRGANYLPGFGTGVNASATFPSVSYTKAAGISGIVNEMAQKYNVPASLINAMIQAESSFNTGSVSAAGAQGLMQLMPGTASDMGVTNPFDPLQNLEGGVKYISKQLERFGDVRLALAAYNYGPNRVSKLGIGDVNQMQEYNKLPEHLQKYIEKILCYEKQFAKGA